MDMAATYSVLMPQITAVSFAQNPTTINTKVVLTVTVTEQLITLEAETIYSGEVYAGEAY